MTRKDENNRPNNRGDIYTRITEQIIAALEQGIKPWTQPWNATHAAGPVSRPLRHNGQPYSGINVLSLWASSMERHFAAPIWMTFKQAHELGGHVRKGEKGSPVVYANTLTRTERDEATGEEVDQTIPFMKGYTVFNIEQIEGLPAHYYAPAQPQLNPDQRVAAADAFFADTGADKAFGAVFDRQVSQVNIDRQARQVTVKQVDRRAAFERKYLLLCDIRKYAHEQCDLGFIDVTRHR